MVYFSQKKFRSKHYQGLDQQIKQWLILIALNLSACDDNGNSSKGATELNDQINFLMSSAAFDNDKKALEEIRYIIEITEKISEDNQKFLAFVRNFGNSVPILFSPENVLTEEPITPNPVKIVKISNKISRKTEDLL